MIKAEYTMPEDELSQVPMTISITASRYEFGEVMKAIEDAKGHPVYQFHGIIREALYKFDEIARQSFDVDQYNANPKKITTKKKK